MSQPTPRQSKVWISALGVLTVVLGAVLLIAFAAPLHSELRLPLFPQDEGLLLEYPALMLHGEVPSHSFESVYGVTNLWIIAAAFKLFGYTVTVERAVGIAYRFVIAASLFWLAWRHRGIIAAFVAGGICIVLFVGTLGVAAYAWMGALAFASLALVLIDVGLRKTMRRLPVALAGVCFGISVGARIDMVLAIALVLIALIATRRECLKWLIIGLLVGVVPPLINVVQAGLPSVIRDQITQPIFVSGPARRLPLSTLTWEELLLASLCVAIAFATVAFGVVLVRRHPDNWDSVLLLVVGAFELGLLPQTFQRSDVGHLSQVACFVLPAAVLLPALRLSRLTAPRTVNWTPVIVGVVVLLLAEPFFGNVYWSEVGIGKAPRDPFSTQNEGRSVPVDSASDRADLELLLKQIDQRSHPGQRIFVGPSDLRTANYNDTSIYFLLPQLTPGSFYLEMNPGVANGTNSQLAADLRQDDLLLLSTRYDDMPDPDSSTRYGPDAPNKVVATQFKEIATRGPWTLYERRS